MHEVQNLLAKGATPFQREGASPRLAIDESWLGRVIVLREGDGMPMDKDGKPMLPLFQLFLGNMQVMPMCLQDAVLLTGFVSGTKFPNALALDGEDFVVRKYSTLDGLSIHDAESSTHFIKPLPLIDLEASLDFPMWGDPEFPESEMDKILEMEANGELEAYHLEFPNIFSHKIGGYPSYSQDSNGFSEGFEFALQLCPDEKANFNPSFGGAIMFAHHPIENRWQIYHDNF